MNKIELLKCLNGMDKPELVDACLRLNEQLELSLKQTDDSLKLLKQVIGRK